MSSWAAGHEEYQEPESPKRADRGKAWLARKTARYREERTLLDQYYRRRAALLTRIALLAGVGICLPLWDWLRFLCGVAAVVLLGSASADRVEARIQRKLRGIPVDSELLDD